VFISQNGFPNSIVHATYNHNFMNALSFFMSEKMFSIVNHDIWSIQND